MKAPRPLDFLSLAKALVFHYEHSGNLFFQSLAEQEGFKNWSPVREEMKISWGYLPEVLSPHLSPQNLLESVKQTQKKLAKTAKVKQDGSTLIPFTREEEQQLEIFYQFYPSPLGALLIACTEKGVCRLVFADSSEEKALQVLKQSFPNQSIVRRTHPHQATALVYFQIPFPAPQSIRLHLKGSPYQLKVWRKLLTIPKGGLLTYSALADAPREAHPVGHAVGSNPVALIIPCHRAIPATGHYGQYHWNNNRKAALLALEAQETRQKL